MKTFFDKSNQQEFEKRLESLSAESKCNWGKMSSAQMLAHLTAGMKVPVGDLVIKRSAASFIGWMFRGLIHSDKPFSRNSPTASEFRIVEPREFDQEKARFTEAFHKLTMGPTNITCKNHPFFGKMTDQDWGCLMYKHLDHHFKQFGV